MKRKLEVPIHIEYSCKGYYGFGTGIQVSRMRSLVVRVDEKGYCEVCPVKQECESINKIRTQHLMPALTEEFERVQAETAGDELATELTFTSMYNVTDPYVLVMAGNVEDGMRVGNGMKVKNRGEMTLEYPFTGN